ncbi:MAG TPA: ATP-binding protein [Gemmatimonadaceae bacterium]|nr:ATP-binding protein [Gemmatimonadaceae bacterium]
MQQTSTLSRGSDVAGSAPVNVLLVDDRPENLLALQAVLEPLGENLVLAHSGEEALTRLLQDDFGLVLLDVQMPGMDGLETSRRMKQRARSAAIPIIFLTANNPDDRMILEGYQSGAADYLFKPLIPEVVQSKVKVFCSLYRSREQARHAATQIARAQAAAAEATAGQKRLTDVLERISDAFFALDDQWRFTYVNEKAALLLRRQRNDMLGKVIWEEFPEAVGSTFYDQYRLAVQSQNAVAFADYYSALQTWFEVHAYPSREGLSVYFEDVSEKKRSQALLQQSEKRFRSLVEATAAAVWKTDAAGMITVEEEDWGRLTGQTFDEMKGFGWLNAVHPDDREKTTERWIRVLESGEVLEMEQRVRTATGEYRQMLVRTVPVFGPTGGIEEWVGTHTDITARKHAEEQRDLALEEAVEAREVAERAQEEAETANRGKSEFLATMSHEFRTPLNAILGYTQLLDMGVLGVISPQQHDHLQRLRSSGIHLLGLVNDILDLSKIEAGRVSVSRETGLVSEVIRGAIALVGPQAVARDIEYPEECEGDPRTSYVGDPDRVRQIMVNLLSNAVKFTHPGGRVTLTCETSDHPDPGSRLVGAGPWTLISVEDTGIGIAPEQLTRIFEPFVQAESGYTRSEGGTGLGLAISRRLARLMGGDITVHSKLQEGSRFTLWLRAASSDNQLAALEHSAPVESTPAVDVAQARDLAAALLRESDRICERYVGRLRSEDGVPDLSGVSEPYVRDHCHTLVAELITAASLIAETKGKASDLLRDGAEVQRLLAELHGAQRFRLGWTESEIATDVDILSEELVAATTKRAGETETAKFFVELIRKILEQWKQTSIRGYRFAKAAGRR